MIFCNAARSPPHSVVRDVLSRRFRKVIYRFVLIRPPTDFLVKRKKNTLRGKRFFFFFLRNDLRFLIVLLKARET